MFHELFHGDAWWFGWAVWEHRGVTGCTANLAQVMRALFVLLTCTVLLS